MLKIVITIGLITFCNAWGVLRDDTKNGCVADYCKRDKNRKKSLTEFSADRGVLVATFKPLSQGLTN